MSALLYALGSSSFLSGGVSRPPGAAGEVVPEGPVARVGPAEGRGGVGDRLRPERLERLQLSLRRDDSGKVSPDGYGVEVEWVRIEFGLSP